MLAERRDHGTKESGRNTVMLKNTSLGTVPGWSQVRVISSLQFLPVARTPLSVLISLAPLHFLSVSFRVFGFKYFFSFFLFAIEGFDCFGFDMNEVRLIKIAKLLSSF